MATQPSITQAQLCHAMKESGISFCDIPEQLEYLQAFVLKQLGIEEPNSSSLEELKVKLRSFLSSATKRYLKSSRKFDHFIVSNSNQIFFSNLLAVPQGLFKAKDSDLQTHESDPKRRKVGRHSVPFPDKSLRGQLAASAFIRQNHEAGAINLAASQQSTPLGKLIKKTKSPSGTTAKLALSMLSKSSKPKIVKKTPEEALAFILENHLTKAQYLNLKNACAESHADIWPCYHKVLEAKSLCRPSSIAYEEMSATVSLQALLNKTSHRILENNPVLTQLTENHQELALVLDFKYGFDGCGSFSTFNQKNESGHVPNGRTLLTSQLVPLQISLKDQPDILVYKNQSPNSASSCRPIRLAYEDETKENIRKEASRLRKEVENLQTFELSESPKITIQYRGFFTLVDGKVLLELTDCPSSSSCPVCHQTYKEISKPEGQFLPKEGSLNYGASILHFGIRSFECLCHIAYRQDVKKTRVRLTPQELETSKEREREVKAQFLSRLGLVVDQRRDGGAGNTTTGNVARKAFQNAEITAEICGVPPELVKNLGTIWGALSCGFDLDPEKFASICQETEKIYFDEEVGVGWYCMPPTLHKILKHGADIIRACPIPIGLTNEEASEANNKFLRRFRLHHSRKTSWREGVKDLYDRLSDISDPVIQESRQGSKAHRKTKIPLSQNILALLKAPGSRNLSIAADCSSSDESEAE